MSETPHTHEHSHGDVSHEHTHVARHFAHSTLVAHVQRRGGCPLAKLAGDR